MRHQKGFTLIEIIVVMAIIGVITSLAMAADLNIFKRDVLKSEISTIVAVLEKARSRSMSNMFDTNHGVCYLAPDYIIFRGNTCVVGALTNELIPANINIISNPSTVFPAIIFDRLTGSTTSVTIHITDGIKSADIIINNEGAINW